MVIGGAALDLVGFAASTAHRGIRLVRFPTTTLSQGDGGVGVKNGINYFGKKNWVGTFSVPYAVVNDFHFLRGCHRTRKGGCGSGKGGPDRDRSFLNKSKSVRMSWRNLMKSRCNKSSAECRTSPGTHCGSGDPFELGSARPWISDTGWLINSNSFLISNWSWRCGRHRTWGRFIILSKNWSDQASLC